MFKKLAAGVAAAALCLTAIATSVFADDKDGVDWGNGTIRATGFAAGKSTTKIESIRRAQARKAARMDAQRNLAEMVRGVRVTSESSVRDLELEYDVVKTSVDATLRDMREVSVKDFDDGTSEVILEMPLFGGDKSLAASAFLPYRDQEKQPFPQPSTASENNGTLVSGVTSEKYTGLIIDCKGLNLSPVMSPVIKNDGGQPIYGHQNLDIDKVIEFGMASYTSNANDAISHERAGENPLVVRAVKVEGFRANPVVSVNDSDRILIANQNDQFLDNMAVVFVK